MPTFQRTDRFDKDKGNLDPEDLDRFRRCIRERFVPAIRAGMPYPGGLRIKGFQGARGIWEMTWAPDGRATFQFGPEEVEGEAHIIWRRVGSHDILGAP